MEGLLVVVSAKAHLIVLIGVKRHLAVVEGAAIVSRVCDLWHVEASDSNLLWTK